jgi:hypothetical protein
MCVVITTVWPARTRERSTSFTWRAEPASGSPILVGYPTGTPLSLTGTCTGGLKLDDINGKPKFQQNAAVRYRWCEVWVDPVGDGNFQSGWVYGKYITPL